MIIPVILSGGSGSRLWPLSRALYPKQLLSLTGKNTMIQDTVFRLASIEERGAIYCVCNESHRFLVAEQLHETGADIADIILEPSGRNTAPAAAVAAMQIIKKYPGAIMLVLPADHVISDNEAFCSAVAAGRLAAEKGVLVTFGIAPSSPETGYGYIKASVSPERQQAVYPVLEFVEKPDKETAERYFSSGEYFWNSGIFLFKAESYLRELEVFNPAMFIACREALEKSVQDLDFLRLDSKAFCTSPSDSIDYAVMEKTSKASVVLLNAGWSDVGAWSALRDVQDRDEAGNIKKGDVLVYDVKNCYIHSTSRLVTAVGLEEHIVVETADAVLVASAASVQDVRILVEELKKSARPEALIHRLVYRPWGSYEIIDVSERFKVKRIMVNPGAALSMQKHCYRAEHWVVVKGTASVIVEDKQIILEENQSTYIPVGAFHRLENTGTTPLELIEVQSGSYLEEDDIIRIDDRYGRT